VLQRQGFRYRLIQLAQAIDVADDVLAHHLRDAAVQVQEHAVARSLGDRLVQFDVDARFAGVIAVPARLLQPRRRGADAFQVLVGAAQRGEVGGGAFQHAPEFQDVVAPRGTVGDELGPRRRRARAQLVGHEHPAAGPDVHEAARAQLLDRFAHGVARHRVTLRELALRRQFRVGRKTAVQQCFFQPAYDRSDPPAGLPVPCDHAFSSSGPTSL
jgi:hypothetical protein